MRLRDKFGNICNVRTEKVLMRCDWEWWGLRIVINGEGCLIANLDANEEVIRKRIDVYKAETSPVFDFYAEYGRSIKINGVGGIEEIFDRLCAEIDSL